MKNTKTPLTKTPAKPLKRILERIAKRILKLDSLEQRWDGELDFHEFAVWEIGDAMADAFEAGRAYEQARQAKRSKGAE